MGGTNGGDGLPYEIILVAEGENVLGPELRRLGPKFDQVAARPCLKMTEKVCVGAVAEKTGGGAGRYDEAGLSDYRTRPGPASAAGGCRSQLITRGPC